MNPEIANGVAAELEAARARRVHMRAVNRIVGARGQSVEQRILRLCRECGMSAARAEGFLIPDVSGRRGFPAYELIENARIIGRHEKRLRELLERAG